MKMIRDILYHTKSSNFTSAYASKKKVFDKRLHRFYLAVQCFQRFVQYLGIGLSPTAQQIHVSQKYGKRISALVANMSIATQRRDLLQSVDCFVCNVQEAGILFAAEFEGLSPEEMSTELLERIRSAHIPAMVVTMGGQGAVFGFVHCLSSLFPLSTGAHRRCILPSGPRCSTMLMRTP